MLTVLSKASMSMIFTLTAINYFIDILTFSKAIFLFGVNLWYVALVSGDSTYRKLSFSNIILVLIFDLPQSTIMKQNAEHQQDRIVHVP